MKEPSLKKLAPYFYRLTDKSRLIVYILATGEYNYDRIRKMTVGDLLKRKKHLPDMFNDIIGELTFDREKDALAFHLSEKKYSSKQISNIVERSHKIAEVEYVSLEKFVKAVSVKKKQGA